MFDYISLPPGRSRRLAYTEYLLSLRRYRNNRNLSISPISDYLHILRYNGDSIFNTTNNYDILSSLKDVKIGLISKDLLEKSNISIKKYFEKGKKKETLDICVICQDSIEENDIIRTIDCSHFFHINCIDIWLIENKKCPLCKFEI